MFQSTLVQEATDNEPWSSIPYVSPPAQSGLSIIIVLSVIAALCLVFIVLLKALRNKHHSSSMSTGNTVLFSGSALGVVMLLSMAVLTNHEYNQSSETNQKHITDVVQTKYNLTVWKGFNVDQIALGEFEASKNGKKYNCHIEYQGSGMNNNDGDNKIVFRPTCTQDKA